MNKAEVAIFFLIPLILTIVFLLPSAVKERLKLDLLHPNVINFYTATFTHEFFDHYLSNIIAYYTFTFIVYYFCIVSDRKQSFIRIFTIFFTTFPLITYTALILFNTFFLRSRLNFTSGFSGINSAILGFLPVSFLTFVKERSKQKISTDKLFCLFFFASALLIPYIHKNYFFVFFVTLITAATILVNRENTKAIIHLHKRLIYQDKSLYLLSILSIALYFGGFTLLFPKAIVYKGGLVDIIVHYIGWILGMFVSYILLKRAG